SRLQKELGVTMIFVTHDQVEAMTMGDRLAVMRKGVLQQVGTPQVVYRQPCNLFVAGFIGSPPMNFVEARLVRSDADVLLEIGDQSVQLAAETMRERPVL